MGNQQKQSKQPQSINQTTSRSEQILKETQQLFLDNQLDNVIKVDQISSILKIDNNLLNTQLTKFIQKLYNTTQINQVQWIELAEILIKAPDYNNKTIQKLKQLELLCLILELDLQTNYENEQCLQFLQCIFWMIDKNGQNAANNFMNRIYDDTLDTSQRLGSVINKINSHIPIVSDYLQQFWVNAFTKGQIGTAIKSAKLNQQSQIFNTELLLLLSLNYNLQKDLTLLYSNQKSGTSFNRLAWNILGYGAPTLFVIYAEQKSTHTGQTLPIIFGAYNSQPWNDGLKFQSDSGCYLFSLSPSYRMFQTSGKEQNYAYLNTKNIEKSIYKVGLGFGGNSEHSSFRLWIDDEIESRSEVHPEDQTYQPGYLAGEIDGKIAILFLEVWGIGGQDALKKQEIFRKERMEELERMRKVDKKQFFSGFDQSMFLSKTFAHKDQVRQDAYEEN